MHLSLHLLTLMILVNIYPWFVPLRIEVVKQKQNFKPFNHSIRSPLKVARFRFKEFHIYVFQNFLKVKKIHHSSRFTDNGPSVAERVIRTIRNLLKKTVFLKANADWITQLSSIIKHYNNTIHHSVEKTTS